MSSFNNIQKIKYTKNPSDPVALKEYILFTDERDKQKFVVFKFLNNLNQCLRAIKFEVKQFDKQNQLVEKSIVAYDNFVAEQNSPFVPNAKLKVSFNCESIQVDTVFAVFDRVKWQGGEFTDNSYKFDRYATDVAAARAPAVKPAAATPTVKVNKTAAKAKAKNAKKPRSGALDITRSNFAKFPKVFNVLICILVIAWAAATVVYFTRTSHKITVDGYDLQVVSSTEANFVGYDGADTQLTVPAKIGDYEVVKISKGAFANPVLKSVVLDTRGSVVIEDGAFENCKNLTSVTSATNAGTFTVMEDAFEDCLKLETVNLPTADLYEKSLNGCVNIKNLTFNSFASNRTYSIASLFAAAEGENVTIDNLQCNLSYAHASFLSGVTVKSVKFNNADFTAEYGAFKDSGLCRYTDSCEVVDGEVISVKADCKVLEIPRYTQKFNPSRFGGLLSSVEKLCVLTMRSDASALKLNSEILNSFPSLKSLEIADEIIDKDTLKSCASIEEFISPVLYSPIKDYIDGTNISALGVTGSGYITYSYLADLKQITSLNIDTTVVRTDTNSFSGLSLTYLSIPNFAGRRINEYAGAIGLTEVELKPFSSYTAVPERCFAGLPLLEKITVAEGFTACNKQIVYDTSALTKISLPESITTFSYPVIYTGCTALTEVKVSFPASAPATYGAFNNSFASTVNLSVGFTGVIPAGFFKDCEKLVRLNLRCGTLGSAQEGLLSDLQLGYLHIQADSILISLEKLLGGVYLQTLVVDSIALPNEFFKGVTLYKALLTSIKTVNSKLFEGSKITSLYFTDSVKYDNLLFNSIKGLGSEIFFKGNQPENSSILNAGQSYRWNYDAESLIYLF